MQSREQVQGIGAVIPTVTGETVTHDLAWMAEQTGKTPDWLRRHLTDIPHHRIGKSVRFTDADLADYLDATAVRPMRMQTTGRRRKSA